MFSRAIFTSAARYTHPKYASKIKDFPMKLWDKLILLEFSSAKEITAFLSESKQFLMDPVSGQSILPHQIDIINLDVVYDVAGSGLPYREGGLTRDQMHDIVFRRKAALTLKKALDEEDPKVVELSRVVRNAAGKDVDEWEAVYELSDGCILFLGTRY